jgi:hypothetical protein
VNLIESCEAQSNQRTELARSPGQGRYWRYHCDQFLQILPPTGGKTVDVGCGEGRETSIPDDSSADEESRQWQRLPLFLHVHAQARHGSLARAVRVRAKLPGSC